MSGARDAHHEATVDVWTDYLPGGEVTRARASCDCGWESAVLDEEDARDAAAVHEREGEGARDE